MTKADVVDKTIAIVSLIALAVLAIGGIVYYKERLFFADASYIARNIVNTGQLAIQEHRYGSFITQMVPWLCAKLHLPVRVALKAYTFSFNFFFLAAGYIVYRCRQYALTTLLALYYFLIVSDSYFWTNNEIHQAVAWMFICFGITLRMGERDVKPYIVAPVFAGLAFLTLYTHFVVLIPFSFLWVFLWIRQDGWPFNWKVSVLLTLCVAAIVISKFQVVDSKGYDDAKLGNVMNLKLRDIWLAFTTEGVKKFKYLVRVNYWSLLLIFPAGVAMAWRAKKPWIAIWSLLTVLGYISLMGMTYPQDGIALFYLESEWQCLGIVAAAAFVYYALPSVKARWAAAMLATIFIVRMAYIANSAETFSWRVHFTKNVLTNMKRKGITKLALVNAGEIQQKLILDWGTADESLLMSAMQHDAPQLTFAFVNAADTAMLEQLKNPKIVLASFGVMTPEDWNYKYFSPDTTKPYVITTYNELLSK